jgi:hypothetical protein
VGNVLGVSVTPHAAGNARLGLLAPIHDGVWDFRSQVPRPGIRVLGLFPERDTFLALIPASRSVKTDYIPWGPLGNGGSDEWKSIITEARSLWTSLMPMWKPVTGDNPDDYFSDNYHRV